MQAYDVISTIAEILPAPIDFSALRKIMAAAGHPYGSNRAMAKAVSAAWDYEASRGNQAAADAIAKRFTNQNGRYAYNGELAA
jgi:hypothetical protein